MQISFDIVETQIARLEGQLSELREQLKTIPEVLRQKLQAERRFDFYKHLLSEDAIPQEQHEWKK